MSLSNNFPTIAPSLNLSFALTKALDPRISFVRTTTATYYDGKTTAKAEENLFVRSQDFATGTSAITGWAKTRATVGSAVTAPDGTTTAEPLTQASGQTVTGFINQACNVVISDYVISVFAKPNGKDFLRVVESIGTGSNRISFIDLSTGTAGTTNAGHTITITSTTEGFYRVSVALSVNATRSGTVFFMLADTDNSDVVTDSGGLILWGAQLEQRSAVTAYTPTTTQPITNYVPVLQTAAAGVARFDHNPLTGESLGLLVEEQRTNLLTYSAEFDNAAWTKFRATVTANTVVAPDGTLTGDKLVATTVSGSHALTQGVSVTAQAYTVSLYAKKGEYDFVQLNIPDPGAGGLGKISSFNLATGTLGAVQDTGVTRTITPVGNGWYRCTVTFTTTGAGTSSIGIFVTQTDVRAQSFVGNDFDGIYIWGAQLEAGAFPTSYIPTVAATVTRNLDTAQMTGTNFSSWFNNAEGSIYAEMSVPFTVPSGTFPQVATIAASNNNNRIQVGYVDAVAANFNVRLEAVNQASISPSVTSLVRKISGAYKTNDFAAVANGGTVSTDTSGTIPIVFQIRFGTGATGGEALNGHIRKVAYYPRRIANAELQALTTV